MGNKAGKKAVVTPASPKGDILQPCPSTEAEINLEELERRANVKSAGNICELPLEIVLMITNHLDPKSALALASTCCYLFVSIRKHDTFWRQFKDEIDHNLKILAEEFQKKVYYQGEHSASPPTFTSLPEEVQAKLLQLTVARTFMRTTGKARLNEVCYPRSTTASHDFSRIQCALAVRRFEWVKQPTTELVNRVFAGQPIYQHLDARFSEQYDPTVEDWEDDAFTWDPIHFGELAPVSTLEELQTIFAGHEKLRPYSTRDTTITIKVPEAAAFLRELARLFNTNKLYVWRDVKFTGQGHGGERFLVVGNENNQAGIVQYEIYSSFCGGLYDRGIACGMG